MRIIKNIVIAIFGCCLGIFLSGWFFIFSQERFFRKSASDDLISPEVVRILSKEAIKHNDITLAKELEQYYQILDERDAAEWWRNFYFSEKSSNNGE